MLAAPEDLPLTSTLRVKLDREARLEVVVEDARGRRTLHRGAARTHEVPLLGSRAGDEVRLSVTAIDEGGAATAEVAYDVGRLPERFPVLDLLVARPELVEPGLTLLPIELQSSEEQLPWLVVIDETSAVVWAWRTPLELGDVRMDPGSGHLLALGDEAAWELDPSGRVLIQWGDERVPPRAEEHRTTGFGGMNHEIFPYEGGFVSLAPRSTRVDHYPCSYAEPERSCGSQVIEQQRVVSWDRDGTTRFDWPLADRLDTFRIGYDALDRVDGGRDWSHANAVVRRPAGGWLVSLRHQDALVALDDEGVIEWILGDPGGWVEPWSDLLLSAVGELRWPYHQHGPDWGEDGTLWVFDNGNEGGTPYGPATPREGSRVVGYRLDEAAGTVEQVAELARTATGDLSSGSMGNVVVLPLTGNLQATFSVVTEEGGVPLGELGFGSRAARIVQWTRGGELVRDLRVRSDRVEEPGGWRVYRATRLDGLYPAGTETWEDPGVR